MRVAQSPQPSVQVVADKRSEPVVRATAVDARSVASELKKIQVRERRSRVRAAQERRRAEQRLAQLQRAAHTVAQARLAQQKKLEYAQKKLRQTQQHLERLHAAAAHKKQQRRAAERLLQQQLRTEQAERAHLEQVAQQAARQRHVLDRYRGLVVQAIGRHWLIPADVAPTLSCTLLVRVRPGGNVEEVRLVRSSGNTALDRSARTAVLKSSPLPVPKEKAVFEQFRTLRLTVRPQDVLQRKS